MGSEMCIRDRHKEDAIRLINEFDNEAWATAQERDTIQGYEDYIEAWPDGLHVAEAQKRIAEIKAAEEARRKTPKKPHGKKRLHGKPRHRQIRSRLMKVICLNFRLVKMRRKRNRE